MKGAAYAADPERTKDDASYTKEAQSRGRQPVGHYHHASLRCEIGKRHGGSHSGLHGFQKRMRSFQKMKTISDFLKTMGQKCVLNVKFERNGKIQS